MGENAFAHESGIHQDGILKNVETYEIMKPEDIGVPKSQLVLGKHSGRHAFAERTQMLGHKLSAEQIDAAFTAFKALADRKKTITNSDIEGLILGREMGMLGPWHLKSLQVSTGSGDHAMHTSAVHLVHDNGRVVREARSAMAHSMPRSGPSNAPPKCRRHLRIFPCARSVPGPMPKAGPMSDYLMMMSLCMAPGWILILFTLRQKPILMP